MRDSFELGCTPCGEDCVQVNPNEDYIPAMRQELNRYKSYLEKLFPISDDLSCYFKIHWQSHDFGRYGEIAICYDDENEKEIEFALNVEGNLPEYWEEEGTCFIGDEDRTVVNLKT
ncbi:MAG: hypothetical protein WA061_02045 [Microgenomates group bacterium]